MVFFLFVMVSELFKSSLKSSTMHYEFYLLWFSFFSISCSKSWNFVSFSYMTESVGIEETTTQSSQLNAMNQSVEHLNQMSNFLYRHPSENPAAPLVSPVLDSTNYHSWSKSMVKALIAKNKVEFVLGSCPCSPKNHPTYSAWYKCNNMVIS